MVHVSSPKYRRHVQ